YVERAEMRVDQQKPRLVGQGLRERGPLAHPPGQLMRVIALEPRQADPLDPIARTFLGLTTVDAAETRTGRHVVEHALPRKDGIDLKDIAHVAPYALHRGAADAHLTLARWLEAGTARARRRFG